MGGIAVWQGFKQHPLQSKIWDYVSYMRDDCLKNDLWRYRLENGHEDTTIEPLVSHRIQYENTASETHGGRHTRRADSPIMLGTGVRFEQPMRTTGEVCLRGKTFTVDGTTVRDRSFGQLRREYQVPLRPLAWMNAASSENFAFSCTAFDDPTKGPEWAGAFSLLDENPLRGDWVFKDGVVSMIARASKSTTRKTSAPKLRTASSTVG
jgi:hypothetical protein